MLENDDDDETRRVVIKARFKRMINDGLAID